MSKTRFENLDAPQLLEKFAALAQQAGSAVLDSEAKKANRALRGLWAIENILRTRCGDRRMDLIPLLDHADRLVRYYAAQALLGVAGERAREIIEWNAKYRFDPIAGDARGLLRALDTGEYKPT